MFSQWTFLERLINLRRFYNKRGRLEDGNAIKCFDIILVLMRLQCHLYSMYPRALSVLQHSWAPYCLHKRLRICSSGQCICSLELRICSFSFASYGIRTITTYGTSELLAWVNVQLCSGMIPWDASTGWNTKWWILQTIPGVFVTQHRPSFALARLSFSWRFEPFVQQHIRQRFLYVERQLFCVLYKWDIHLSKFEFLHLTSLI